MKKLMSMMLGLSLLIGSASFMFAQEKKEGDKKEGKKGKKKKSEKKEQR